MCGAEHYEETYKLEIANRGFILDDTGDNISHLNQWYGELTGLYWVWKNTNDLFVGTNQYRLFWNTLALEHRKDVIYVPNPLNVTSAVRNIKTTELSIYDQYSHCHGELHWNLLYGLVKTRQIPLKAEMIDELKTHSYLIPFNMFIADRAIFNKICEILFEILFRYYESYHIFLPILKDQQGQARNLDFLAERILHMIYSNIDYYINNVKVVTVSLTNYEHG
jgi:hypothetical protein